MFFFADGGEFSEIFVATFHCHVADSNPVASLALQAG
jgi:hypothetical protein